MGIILALIIFSFIVFFHELGHFLLAKKSGIRVEEFSIGMGPRLISKVIGETRYSWKLLPIGGSCMMGEDDADDVSEGSFNSKSVWARISVIAGGPIFNFILAFLFSLIIIGWMGIDKPIVGSVAEDYPAAEAGLMKGDRILKLNGQNIHVFREISTFNQFHQGQRVQVVYERDGKEQSVTIDPKKNKDGLYLMGLGSQGNTKGNVWEVISYSAHEVKYTIQTTLESLKLLVTGVFGIEQMSGPVGIVDVVGDAYEASRPGGIAIVIVTMLNLAILLSANLGVMNLLPLPALDGGRLVFLFVEAIRGKRVPPEKEGVVHIVGMACLLMLMVIVMFNDIKRIFF